MTPTPLSACTNLQSPTGSTHGHWEWGGLTRLPSLRFCPTSSWPWLTCWPQAGSLSSHSVATWGRAGWSPSWTATPPTRWRSGGSWWTPPTNRPRSPPPPSQTSPWRRRSTSSLLTVSLAPPHCPSLLCTGRSGHPERQLRSLHDSWGVTTISLSIGRDLRTTIILGE